MNARAKALYDRGMREVGGDSLLTRDIVRCMAAMLDMALPEKKTRAPGGKDLLIGTEVLATLMEKAPNAVIWKPHAPGTVKALGAAARQAGDDHAGIALLVAKHLAVGALDWMRDKPTLTYVARNYLDLVARAAQQKKTEPERDAALDRLRDEGEL